MHDAYRSENSPAPQANLDPLSFAMDILKTTRDHEVINRIQILIGYSQLADLYPSREIYRLKVTECIDALNTLVRSKANPAA